jgi:hypothetical protein
MLLLLPLAVRIETLAEGADALFEFSFFQRGEWEGFETPGAIISWCRAKPAPVFVRPCAVNITA